MRAKCRFCFQNDMDALVAQDATAVVAPASDLSNAASATDDPSERQAK